MRQNGVCNYNLEGDFGKFLFYTNGDDRILVLRINLLGNTFSKSAIKSLEQRLKI